MNFVNMASLLQASLMHSGRCVFLLWNHTQEYMQHNPTDIWLPTNIFSQFSACSLDNSGLLCPHVSSKLSGKVNTLRGSGSTKQTASQDLVEGHSHDFEWGTWPPGSCFVPDVLHFKSLLCFSVLVNRCAVKWASRSLCIDFGNCCCCFFSQNLHSLVFMIHLLTDTIIHFPIWHLSQR